MCELSSEHALDMDSRSLHVVPLQAGALEAAIPASEYGMAAFVFRKDLREMLSTILQLLASIERDAGVGKLNVRKSTIALYYMSASVVHHIHTCALQSQDISILKRHT